MRALPALLALAIATSGCAARVPANPDYTPASNVAATAGVVAASIGADILDRHPSSKAGAAWAAAGGVLLGAALVDAIFVEEELKRTAARESIERWYRRELMLREPPDAAGSQPAAPLHRTPPGPDPSGFSPLGGDPRRP